MSKKIKFFIDSRSDSDLRPVPNNELWKLESAGATNSTLLCSACRKQLKDYIPPASTESQSESLISETQTSSEKFSSQGSIVESGNACDSIAKLLGVSPVKRK